MPNPSKSPRLRVASAKSNARRLAAINESIAPSPHELAHDADGGDQRVDRRARGSLSGARQQAAAGIGDLFICGDVAAGPTALAG